MAKRTLIFLAVSVFFVSLSDAADKVRIRQGAPVSGTVTQMSPDEVEIEQGPIKKKIPVNEILSVEYDEEPAELSTLVRSAYEDGRYAEALSAVKKIDAKEIERSEILQDLAFYRAACSVRMALSGNLPPAIARDPAKVSAARAEAGRLLMEFESKQSGSYHYLETCQLLGDLLVSMNKLESATKYYDKLANSSFPEYKLKAGVLVGRALESLKQYDKAIAKYEDVISGEGTSKEAIGQKLTATCGKATSLAATGKADEAIKIVEEVIAKADPGDVELHARAYNSLGSCYRSAGKKKEALIAYLHTDLLFGSFPEQHAEALAALATLWTEAEDKPDRAEKAKELLKTRYPGSRWAQGK